MTSLSDQLIAKKQANFKSDIKENLHDSYLSDRPKRGDKRRDFGSEVVFDGYRWQLVSGYQARGEALPGSPLEKIVNDCKRSLRKDEV